MASLTAEQADALLDKLSSDEGFRKLLLDDPAAALKQVGAPVELAACFGKCNGFADAATIKSSRVVLQQQLTSTLALHVHNLRSS